MVWIFGCSSSEGEVLHGNPLAKLKMSVYDHKKMSVSDHKKISVSDHKKCPTIENIRPSKMSDHRKCTTIENIRPSKMFDHKKCPNTEIFKQEVFKFLFKRISYFFWWSFRRKIYEIWQSFANIFYDIFKHKSSLLYESVKITYKIYTNKIMRNFAFRVIAIVWQYRTFMFFPGWLGGRSTG